MAEDGTRRVLTFASMGRRLALDAADVAEVMTAPKLTRVPQAPAALAGLANLRGKVAPIVSVAALLGETPSTEAARVIVLDRDDPIGLAVDTVDGMQGFGADAADGLIDAEGGPIRVLDLEPLLAAAFAGLARAGAARSRDRALAPTAVVDHDDTTPYLAFDVAGQLYALPLEQVREVTRPPQTITRLPQTDAAAQGVISLRGALLPLVSVRALLGLPADEDEDEGSGAVVVATLGGVALGLLVDRTRAIMRLAPDAVRPVPSVLNRGGGEARIAAVAHTPGGLVSILAAERIFREETVARVLAEGAGGLDEAHADNREAQAMEQFLLFRLGDERYGLPVAAVEEVLMLPEHWTRVPRAPAFILGVTSHRGVVLPLIDQRRRFQVEGEAAAKRRVIVTRVGDTAAGFVVDAVERILDVPAEALAPAPDLAGEGESPFDRVSTLEADGRLVLLVDPRQLLDQAERDLVAALAARGLSTDAEAS